MKKLSINIDMEQLAEALVARIELTPEKLAENSLEGWTDSLADLLEEQFMLESRLMPLVRVAVSKQVINS